MKKAPAAWLTAGLLVLIGYGTYTGVRKSGQEARATVSRSLVEESRAGSVEDIQKLLLAGADVNTVYQGRTPLEAALLNCGNSTTRQKIKLLLEKSADVNLRAYSGAYTPIMTAAENCRAADILKQLIAAGADVNVKGKLIKERTPLMLVAERDFGSFLSSREQVDVTEVLLDAGAKVDSTNDAGDTALLLVADNMRNGGRSFMDMFVLLASHGADVNMRNAAGQTPLKIVESGKLAQINRQEYLATIEHLKKLGAHD